MPWTGRVGRGSKKRSHFAGIGIIWDYDVVWLAGFWGEMSSAVEEEVGGRRKKGSRTRRTMK
jgi:hypothetical protein